MESLTFPNVEYGRMGLDWAGCGCSSSRIGKSLVGSWGKIYAKRGCGREMLLCRRKVGHGRVTLAQMPVTVHNDIRDSASTLKVKPKSSSPISVSSLLEAVAGDLKTLNNNLKTIIGSENPVLVSAAEQIFGAGGKRLRPALVFLVSRATTKITGLKDLTPQHRRLAEIIEMIHTASLIHDDVLDDSGMRRGKETIHQIYGTRVAVLAGDFMFAQSSWYLANIENLEVIKLISQVIKDFASGEIKQASSLFDCDVTLDDYLVKSYYKTASLISASTKAAAIFSGAEGYESELRLLHRHFHSSLHLFHHQSSLNLTSSTAGVASDPAGARDLGELTMFLAHVTPFYPKHLADFPQEVADLLRSAGRSLPSSLRCQLAQALILLVNRKTIDIGETLALFMELQILGDRALRKLAFSHVVHSIRRMNQKHKNEAQNRKLQNILYAMLQEEDELRAKRSLVVLCDLHRRRVWFDDRTANAICAACFHTSSRIMISSLSFLLGYERIEDGNDSDDSSDEDDAVMQNSQFVLSREAVYKAHHKGTSASKKKKQAKLQRVVRNIKRKQRMSSENNSSNYYSPLTHLKDAQGFVEKLFSRLQTCNERFEVKMMMLKVIARTVGLHKLILLNFYPFLQKYVQPHQRDITNLLAAAVQACHDMVPPDAVESLFRQIVNQFVHDHSRTEAIAIGLNVVREICLRMPLLMTEDLLQDLVLYKKSHEKAVSTAARSLITLFREVCPSLLVKKDRGRPTDPKARPKAFGEVNVASNVPGAELLQCDSESASDRSDDEEGTAATDDELAQLSIVGTDGVSNVTNEDMIENNGKVEEDEEEEASESHSVEDDEEEDDDDDDEEVDEEDNSADDVDSVDGDDEDDDGDDDNDEEDDENDDEDGENGEEKENPKSHKRKLLEYDEQLIAGDASLRALKRLAVVKMANISSDATDGILSNEDFRRIKVLKAKKDAKVALTQQGLIRKGSDSKFAAFKMPSSDELSVKRVDPSKLEMHVRRKLSKEERLALVKAGREERGKYQARAAVKQKKTGGLSNRQKEHKKAMPLAAKRAKVTRSRQEKKKQQKRAGKQFRGKKAWK